HLLINVELKTDRYLSDGLEAEAARVLGRHAADRRVLVSSFNPLALARFRPLAPAVPIALLLDEGQRAPLRRAWAAPILRPLALHPEAALVDAIALARWRRRGYAVNVWTVDHPFEVAPLVALGVDGIITNQPARTRALVLK